MGKTILEFPEKVESLDELKKGLDEVGRMIQERLGVKMNQRNSRVVEQMISFIEENYSKDISLSVLSQHIFLTPNYLGSIFLNHTGLSFKNYVTKVRMEKAKELLIQGNYKIYEVCEMVGYKKLDHFRKLFREYTGLNPSDLMP